MFDFIMCEYPIVTHKALIKACAGFPVQYQTKDTPDQSMTHYKIDSSGVLWKNYIESEWTADITNFLGGYSKTISEEWRKDSFSGEINFYESIPHPDRHSVKHGSTDYWFRYGAGWIEFKAIFLEGYLVGNIECVTNTDPVRRSDEEVERITAIREENRQKNHESSRKNRKERPTPEQSLIDSLYDRALTAEAEGIEYANIAVKYIEEYREKHDKFYEEIK